MAGTDALIGLDAFSTRGGSSGVVDFWSTLGSSLNVSLREDGEVNEPPS